MSRIVRLSESKLYSLIENIISTLRKDVNQPLWNVYRIPAKIGVNGYAISSNFNEKTLLNQLISFSKNKWKKGGTPISIQDEDGSGYMYRYIISLIVKAVLENPEIVNNKSVFTKEIAKNFDDVERINSEPLTKADAEMLKRKAAASDPNSFKRKGAAILRELDKEGKGKKSFSKLSEKFQDTIWDLFESDELQYYDEDGALLYHKSAYDKLMSSNLPQSIKDDLTSIDNDPKSSIDPMTGKKFSYKLKMIPQ
jgi:hypothetical protein